MFTSVKNGYTLLKQYYNFSQRDVVKVGEIRARIFKSESLKWHLKPRVANTSKFRRDFL